MGDAHINRERIETALERYRNAVKLAAEAAEAADSRDMGDAYVYADQTINALRQYRRAIRHSARRALPHFSLAELYRRYGKLKAALIEYRNAIECDPKNAYYHFRLGDCLADAGYLPEAIGELETSVEMLPADRFTTFGPVIFIDERPTKGCCTRDAASRDVCAVRRLLQHAVGHPVQSEAATLLRLQLSLTHALRLDPANAVFHCLIAAKYRHSLSDDVMADRHYAAAGQMDAYDREHIRRLRELTMDNLRPRT